MKKYKWIVDELELKIKKEKTLREDLEKKKKKLKDLIYELGEKIKRIEKKISTLEYKIYKNNRFMEKYNPERIRSLSRMAIPISALSYIGILAMVGKLDSIFRLGNLAGAAISTGVISYSIQNALTNACKKREEENKAFTKEITELQKEKDDLTDEITMSQDEIKNIEKEFKKSELRSKDFSKDLEYTVNEWNATVNKKTDNPPVENKVMESQKELKGYVLKKMAPKDLYEEFVKAT